jgi:hypothetical protein
MEREHVIVRNTYAAAATATLQGRAIDVPQQWLVHVIRIKHAGCV